MSKAPFRKTRPLRAKAPAKTAKPKARAKAAPPKASAKIGKKAAPKQTPKPAPNRRAQAPTRPAPNRPAPNRLAKAAPKTAASPAGARRRQRKTTAVLLGDRIEAPHPSLINPQDIIDRFDAIIRAHEELALMELARAGWFDPTFGESGCVWPAAELAPFEPFL